MRHLLLTLALLCLCPLLPGQPHARLLPHHAADGAVVFAHEHSQGEARSGAHTIPVDPAALAGPMLLTRLQGVIGNQTPAGHGQVSSQTSLILSRADAPENVTVTLRAGRNNRDRAILFAAGGINYEVPVNFPVDSELTFTLVQDWRQNRFLFLLAQNNMRIFNSDWQPGPGRPPGQFSLAVRAQTNDGLHNRFSAITFTGLDEAALARVLQDGDQTGIPPCSTFPRRYQNVNPAMYNSSITSLTGSNNIDRLGLLNPAEAENRVRQLHELGFSGALYNGRHFRMNYVEEFPLIRESAKILQDACRRQGIAVIEHHEPTIMAYRGYPLMLQHLDWLQSDIRSGETNFWFCPVNPDFKQAFLDYLARYHETVRAPGYMIDEIARANRNACHCASCRDSFTRATGETPPGWTRHDQPSGLQKAYMQHSNEQISAFKCSTLAMLQGIAPETFIMTYCSDYADPVAQMEDLTLHAALFSSFVGWENMIYDPLNSWTSMMRCLKMRNSYGDFYNIPVWSLNREQVAREAHYLAWAMCQGTRHGIWFGSRLPLDTPENRAFFSRYNAWPDTMPHQFARTLTRTGLLISAQAKKATASRSFFWEDLCGVMDTLIRGNHQFDTLLDGDLFYPGRLAKYQLLWLVSQATLSDRQCANLSQWVEQGGCAIVTRNTSLYDEAGNRRHDFKLSAPLNLRSSNTTARLVRVRTTVPEIPGDFTLAAMTPVTLIQPERSKILAYGLDAEGREMPLVVETAYGKGRFIHVAAPLGDTLYEMEMRKGRTYNYSPDPPLQAFVRALHAYAAGSDIVHIEAPEKVIALVNQQQDDTADIYVQLYNFTGQTIRKGDKRSYGVPESISFPALTGDMVITLNRPCATAAVLSTPERDGQVAIAGTRQGQSTVFTIPGSLLGAFAQVKIPAEKYPDQAILQPPLEPTAPPPDFVLSPREIDLDALYHPERPPDRLLPPTQDSVLLRLNGMPVIASDALEVSLGETSPPLRSDDLRPAISAATGFEKGTIKGELAAGKLLGGDFAFVREVAWHENGPVEITLAGILAPKNHPFSHLGYVIRIPVDILRGATAEYSLGMHRSLLEPRSLRLTGSEPEGAYLINSVRQIQFSGGQVDFMLDFANEGIWGIFIEGLSSQYKAHLRRQGDFYVFYLVQNTGVKFGAKNASKITIRPGKHDYRTFHPFNYVSYQLNRPASVRWQFATDEPVAGFAHLSVPGYNQEFSLQNPGPWEKTDALRPVRHAASRQQEPLFASAVRGRGPNTLKLPHANGIVLVNLGLGGLGGPIRGSVNTGGRDYPFNLAEHERQTLVLPTWVRNGEIAIHISGDWALCHLVVQPLMSEAEDFLFARSWWNCGMAPYLLPELKQNRDDWRFWCPQPYRQAKWNW